MKTQTLPVIALAGALAASSLPVPTYAASRNESREATALQGTKVSLPEAIAIAERQTGGQAYDAGVDLKHGVARIGVQTNGPRGVQTVIVDAQSGQIVGTHRGPERD